MEEYNVQEKKKWYKDFKNWPISYYIVFINILIFLILHLSNYLTGDSIIIDNFAKITSRISIQGEYYRFFTTIFIHEGITHLAFNSAALIFLARPIEMIFGKTKFLLIFITAGLFGSLFSFIFSPYPAIGASGGIFGIFGVHLFLYIKNKDVYLKHFGKEIFQLLILNIFIGFIIPNIDYWGHFGGIVGGFLASNALGLSRHYRFNTKKIAVLTVTIVLFFSSFMIVDHAFKTYYYKLDQYVEQGNIAIANKDYTELQSIHENIQKEKPFLPPFPNADYVSDQIQEVLDKAPK
jgi:rhomboid protease GluP